ncbi:MAG: DUF1343 domain-containing protein [Deltaproteobacteria bacterium]|nr:DUF1343 domain-containing protein [Deltaproteobacteria bacterium]MBW2217949.1 DUF1343 domain-containing protein [Deltaproteobacteria bacterium]
MTSVKTGLENFLSNPPEWVKHKRLGLLCNPASVDRQFRHAGKLIDEKFPGQLAALFSPQHGFFAEKQDNMIESDNIRDPALNIPIFSLYGKTRIPTAEMLDHTDIVIIDLQDIGTRVYTFIYTVSYCLEAAKQTGTKIIVLDRPNPLNGVALEGNILSSDCTSFVGRYPIPMRHGLTVGELALMFNEYFDIGCDLSVVPMKNWKRSMYFDDTGLPWIPPSPNLPTPASALVYPGQVIWEGTNISEGRGTTQPFEVFGAPFLDIEKILSFMGGHILPGTILRPLAFEPTSNKWQKEFCKGFQIHITDRDQYKPYITSLKLLQGILTHFPELFKYKNPPYEYEFKRLPIDLIIGDKEIRKRLENFDNLEEIENSWQQGINDFRKRSEPFVLYS